MPLLPPITTATIPYVDAPSGTVLIGKYVPPFREVAGGHGFLGVLVADTATGKLQCHACGRWTEQLNTHVWMTHKQTARQYKDTYGLLHSTALVSDRLRHVHADVAIVNTETYGPNWGTPEHRVQRIRERNASNKLGKKTALEHKNKYGVCYDQLIARIRDLAAKLKRTPTLVEIKAKYGGGSVTMIHYTFGGYGKACEAAGLQKIKGTIINPYTRDDLLNQLRRFIERERRLPMWTDANRGLFSANYSVWKKHFPHRGLMEARTLLLAEYPFLTS